MLELLQDEANRLWERCQNEEEIFNSRLNFFLVSESVFVDDIQPFELTQAAPSNTDFRSFFVEKIFHPFIVIGVPLILIMLLICIIYQSFYSSFSRGIRGVAAVLLSFVSMSYIYSFQLQWIRILAVVPQAVLFLISVALGFWLLKILNSLYKADLELPILELIFSAVLSLLIIGYLGIGEEILNLYYGNIIGFLLYVFIYGIPINSKN